MPNCSKGWWRIPSTSASARGRPWDFLAKGVPAKAVGALANEPLSMGLIVGAAPDIRKPEDLKGKKIGVTTAGSLSYWLVRELSRQLGWGSNGIEPVGLGAMTAMVAALKRGQIDGVVLSASQGYGLEKTGDGRLLLQFGTYIKNFHTHVIFATDAMIANKPDQVRRFLAGWKDVDRVHGGEQGRDRAHRPAGHRPRRSNREPRIRRRHADDVARPAF